MSNLHQEDNSSSDEEYNKFGGNINIPSIQSFNKHKRNKSGSNIVKVGKKIVGRNVRFPYESSRPNLSPRQSYMSAASSLTNNSSATHQQESDDSDDQEEAAAAASLPRFQMKESNPEAFEENDDSDDIIDPDEINLPDQLDESDSEDDQQSRQLPQNQPQEQLQGLSRQADHQADHQNHHSTDHDHHSTDHDLASQTSKDSKQTRTSSIKNHFFRRSSLQTSNLHRGETDITDQLGSTASHQSSQSSRSASRFREILRKVALTDQQYPEGMAPADTFIGRVLDNDGSNYGLGGGGLVPGASRRSREKTIDEEEEVGMDDEDNLIELQKLNFAQLNNEARNIINVHVPDKYKQETIDIAPVEHSSSETISKEKDHSDSDNDDDLRPNSLYAPNPDIFLRGNGQYDAHDNMMLDDSSEHHIAPPSKVQAGVLSSLLKLYQNPDESKSSSSVTYGDNSTLHDEDLHNSRHSTLLNMKENIRHGGKKVYGNIPFVKKAGTSHKKDAANDGDSEDNDVDDQEAGGEYVDAQGLPSFQNAKPKIHKKATVNPHDVPGKVSKRIRRAKRRQEEQLRITVHIADVLQRQRFIMLMCKALMLFGAPTHRLEEYMIMTSRVLEIDGQFIYFPGCMIMAFGDAATRTSEVHLVKCTQGVNLSKLSLTHKIYKNVIHDLMGVEEASTDLNKILRLKNNYNPWFCVFFYGLGSAMVCPFAFGGGWTDIPIAFGVGLCVGYLQFFVSAMSNLYSSVFEVTSSIVVSFIARAIGSINNGNTFCFSAIAQGSLALILPGYIILCGSLELQSRNLVAGSVRMFYAVIYSLFLGFGITLGASLYGWVDKNSVSETKCQTNHGMDAKWRILFVPAFTVCLGLINQADLRQLPIMVAISGAGYVGNYFAGLHFKDVTEFTASIGAFIVGILGNLYSRIGKGLAVSAMLPAIFVQVPSGIASQSSLLSGVLAANQITKNSTTSSSSDSSTLGFGGTMVEVAVGISVGLFAAAIFIYPFGKKRTGLFSL